MPPRLRVGIIGAHAGGHRAAGSWGDLLLTPIDESANMLHIAELRIQRTTGPGDLKS